MAGGSKSGSKNVGGTSKSKSKSKSKSEDKAAPRTRFRWNVEDRTKTMLKIWISEKEKGGSQMRFAHHAVLFNQRTGCKVDTIQVRNHYAEMRDKYRAHLTLQKMTGIAFNHVTGEVDVAEDELPRWNAYMKTFARCGLMVARGELKNIVLLERLFHGQVVVGVDGCFSPAMAKTPSHLGKGKTSFVDLNLNEDPESDDPYAEDTHEGSGDSDDIRFDDNEMQNISSDDDDEESEVPLVVREKLGKKRPSEEDMYHDLKKRNSSLDTVIQLLSEDNKSEKHGIGAAELEGKKETWLSEQCSLHLERMGLHEEEDGDVLFVAAMEFLEDKRKASTFLSLVNDNQRRIYLRRANVG